jgi:hypothetical protein
MIRWVSRSCAGHGTGSGRARRGQDSAGPQCQLRAQHRRGSRAYGAAFRFLRDPVNRNGVADLIAETTGAPLEVARQILALYYQPDRGVMPKQAVIIKAGMAKVIEMLAETGQIAVPPPAERFVDLQYLQAAGLQ